MADTPPDPDMDPISGPDLDPHSNPDSDADRTHPRSGQSANDPPDLSLKEVDALLWRLADPRGEDEGPPPPVITLRLGDTDVQQFAHVTGLLRTRQYPRAPDEGLRFEKYADCADPDPSLPWHPARDLPDLVESVRRHGILRPLGVSPSLTRTGAFEVVDGVRRMLVARWLLTQEPASPDPRGAHGQAHNPWRRLLERGYLPIRQHPRSPLERVRDPLATDWTTLNAWERAVGVHAYFAELSDQLPPDVQVEEILGQMADGLGVTRTVVNEYVLAYARAFAHLSALTRAAASAYGVAASAVRNALTRRDLLAMGRDDEDEDSEAGETDADDDSMQRLLASLASRNFSPAPLLADEQPIALGPKPAPTRRKRGAPVDQLAEYQSALERGRVVVKVDKPIQSYDPREAGLALAKTAVLAAALASRMVTQESPLVRQEAGPGLLILAVPPAPASSWAGADRAARQRAAAALRAVADSLDV